MFEFYKEYVRKDGFPVQRRSRRMTDDGILRSVTFACAKGREHQSRTQNQTKPRGHLKVDAMLILQEGWSYDEGYLENVFWEDGMSRAGYKEFGEVTSFDTKYLYVIGVYVWN
ncbi:hypothetical protein C5167_009440 [Papaver somniferum]|uniref:Uncharacterized protein n=1 Tax=Papaver somniferum TaxID=3469 RepID=A0A4Y7K1D2_PAPSO|nr:hypothetical protein C5167_009440 [Papaver somniferum]